MKRYVRRLIAVVLLSGTFLVASAPIASAASAQSMQWCWTLRMWHTKLPMCVPIP